MRGRPATKRGTNSTNEINCDWVATLMGQVQTFVQKDSTQAESTARGFEYQFDLQKSPLEGEIRILEPQSKTLPNLENMIYAAHNVTRR